MKNGDVGSTYMSKVTGYKLDYKQYHIYTIRDW